MKIIITILIFIIIGLMVIFKSSDDKNSISGRYYSDPESDYKNLLPYVDLYKNDEFYIMNNALSSGLILGTYKIDHNYVILKSDENEKYRFRIENNTLIYMEDKNAKIEYLNDQMVFYLQGTP